MLERVSVAVLVLSAAPGAFGQDVHLEFYGQGEKWWLERVGAVGDDLDGDGVGDLLLGAPTGGGSGHGGALLVVSGANGSLVFPPVFGPKDFGYGHYVRGVGDFDGDGVGDYVDGVVDIAGCMDGEVNLYSGTTGTRFLTIPCPPEFLCEEQAFGYQPTSLGDLDQDGFPELAVNFWFEEPVVIYHAPDAALMRAHRGAAYGGIGVGRTSLAALGGDVDADGIDDYAIGYSHGTGFPPYPSGMVVLFSGATGDEVWRILGPSQAHLGSAVVPMGDLDLDGIPDLAVGSPFSAGCDGPYTGWVEFYSGADADLIRRIDAPVDPLWSGHCPFKLLEGGGDANGDGFQDLIADFIGANFAAVGAVAVYSGATGTMLWRHSPGGGWLGTSAFVGDLDHDGFDEFGIGYRNDSSQFPFNGKVTVFRGAAGDAYRVCEATTNSAGTQAVLDLEGPISVGNNALALHVTDAIPGATGSFFYGRHRLQQVLGESELCIGAFFRGIVPRIGAPLVVAADGTAYANVDMTQPPMGQGPLAWASGSTWTVQFRYADSGSPTGFAVSDAFEITFTP